MRGGIEAKKLMIQKHRMEKMPMLPRTIGWLWFAMSYDICVVNNWKYDHLNFQIKDGNGNANYSDLISIYCTKIMCSSPELCTIDCVN